VLTIYRNIEKLGVDLFGFLQKTILVLAPCFLHLVGGLSKNRRRTLSEIGVFEISATYM
jgi:hypothetical protein